MKRMARVYRAVAVVVLVGSVVIVLGSLSAIQLHTRQADRARAAVAELGLTVASAQSADAFLKKYRAAPTDADLQAYGGALRDTDRHVNALIELIDDPAARAPVRKMSNSVGRRLSSLRSYVTKQKRATAADAMRPAAYRPINPAVFPSREMTFNVTRGVGLALESQIRGTRIAANQILWAATLGLGASVVLIRGSQKVARRETTERLTAEQRCTRLEADLEDTRAQVDAATRSRDEFLAALGHELRTPLAPVLMAVTAALERGETTADRSTLEMIRRNISLETRLLDDLFDLSRLNHTGLPLELEPVDVHRAVRRALDVCRHDVRRAGLHVVIDLTARIHHLRATEARLMQVFWNLIQNAARYTPNGGTLLIRSSNEGLPDGPPPVEPEGASGGPRLVIAFHDTGQGIASEFLARVFDPFDQASDSGKRRPFGLGLGLTISRGIVEEFGGRLTASSPGPGQGSTFRVELPLPSTPAPIASAEPSHTGLAARGEPREPVEPAPERTLTILLVDDEPDTTRYLAHLLRDRGHTVLTASSLSAARKALATVNGPIHLLISDIQLPDGTGLDLVRELPDATPAIALSGYSGEEERDESRRAGFEVHLGKPVEANRILAFVAAVARNEPIG